MSDRPTADDLAAYYATREGRRVGNQLARIVAPAIRHGPGARLLAIGHPAPLLTGLQPADFGYLALLSPDTDGVAPYPADGANCTLVADPAVLPFTEALFDQVLLVHALEFAAPPRALLRELWRVLAPAGDIILIVPNRAGIWMHFESTPFGHGRPWGYNGLMRLLRDAMFEPTDWQGALAAPPVRGLRWLDRPLTRAVPRIAGVHIVRAHKTDGLGLVGPRRVAGVTTRPAEA